MAVLSSPKPGAPQLTTIWDRPDDSSNDRQPACASREKVRGGGAPTSAIISVAPDCKPLVPGVGRVLYRLRPHVVISKQRGEQVGAGRAHAVEARQRPVAVPEQAQHRHHAVDAVDEIARRREASRRVGLA